MKAYLLGLRNYVNFKGRSTRAQYWKFVLVVVLMLLAAAFVDSIFSTSTFRRQRTLTLIVGLAHFVPFVAYSVRRLHDTDRSGWWYFVNAIPFGQIVFVVFMGMASTPGPNRFGAAVEPTAPGASLNGEGYGQPMPSQPITAAPEAKIYSQPTPPSVMSPTGEATLTAAKAPLAASCTVIEQLERLASLKASGVIDEAEFLAMKADVLKVQA